MLYKVAVVRGVKYVLYPSLLDDGITFVIGYAIVHL